MGKERRERGPGGRLAALLTAGDHGAARREARALVEAPGTPEPERREAAAVLAGLAPERLAAAVGLGGAVLALLVLGWLVTR